jgi:Domain of unknown function (DUF4190)
VRRRCYLGGVQSAPSAQVRHLSAKAVAALALSTVFSVLPLVPSATAVILGQSARREIRRDRSLTGEGVAQAGVILGVLGTLVWLAVILASIFFIDEARSLG